MMGIMKTFSTLLKIILIAFCVFLNVSNGRAEERRSIAVLPFENLMKDSSIDGLLSYGMALFIHFKT